MGPDLLNPLDGLIGRFVHGPMHRFSYSRECDYTGYEVEMLLRQYGIRVWGREFDDPDELAILVRRNQAVWAEYILCRAGVPLTCQLLDSRNAAYRERHADGSMPDPWHKEGVSAQSPIDHLVDWLARLLP